jgi:hypothetical protein
MSTSGHAARLIAGFGTAALFAVGACSKDKGAAVDTTTAAAPAPASAPSALSVMDIDMGRHIGADKKISDKTDDFAPTDTIYASVHTTGAASGSTMVGRWNFNDSTVVHEDSQTVSPTGDAYTEFHITKPGGWPKGKYTVHILLDGKEVRTKDVTVK